MTYAVLQRGGTSEDEVFDAGIEAGGFLGLSLEGIRGVELCDVLLEGLEKKCEAHGGSSLIKRLQGNQSNFPKSDRFLVQQLRLDGDGT